MDEKVCIICFSHYDDDEQRPRVLPCGHTICSVCLMKGIQQASKICPTCRRIYVASNVKDIPVNFSLEGVVKSVKTSDKLPECAEHLLQVTHRCSTHKAWICQSCINEDHSLKSCKIITINEELKNKKSLQLNQSQPLVDAFEETCKASNDQKMLCREVIEDINEDIIRDKTIVKRLNEEIQRKTTTKMEMEKTYREFDHKLETLKRQRSSYDKAVTTLISTDTIREVSRCSVEVKIQAEYLQSISQAIENELDLMRQAFNVSSMSSVEQFPGPHKLSIRNRKYHLHGFQIPPFLKEKNMFSKSPPFNLQFSDGDDHPLTDGILTFLDIAWPGQEPRRVYMKMIGNTDRARQHLLLVTGHCGYSYKGLSFYEPDKVGESVARVIIGAYDGGKATSLLNNVTATDDISQEYKAGLMYGVGWDNDNNNALVAWSLNDKPESYTASGFGQVTSGLDVLHDIARSEEVHKIEVVDCGVVIYF